MKRMAALLLALILLIPLASSCAPKGGAGEKTAIAEDLDGESLLSTQTETYGNDYEAYLGMLQGMYAQGEYFDSLGLFPQAAYMYHAGAAAAGSLRFCMECVLFLKGEGESLEEVVMAPFADWDSLARLSPVSPYPDYFEGLVYQMQGNSEKASEYFTRAVTFPSWPQAGWDFTYLKMLPVSELFTLRDALLETENSFHTKSQPQLMPVPRDPYNFSAEYLIALAGEAAQRGDNELAWAYARSAVRADPFSGDAFAAAALTGMAVGERDLAADYINDGLYIAPSHAGLKALLTAFAQEG